LISVAAPLSQCWTKATDAEPGPPRYSANWALARRARFKSYPDRIECGDWVIPATDVRDAVLYEARQWFIPVYVLAVSTERRTWQFGFNPWCKVAAHLPFAFRRERVRLRHSAFSLAVRALLVAYLAFVLWRFLRGR
jgi:hypothetical protein